VSWRQVVPGSLYGPARRILTPVRAGRSSTGHVALTFDDGPDPESTPHFLDLLAQHEVRGTFFMLGERAVRHPDVVRQIAAEGHEPAVHGWTHGCVARLSPGRLSRELASARSSLEDLAGQPVRWYRPPYGIATVASNQASVTANLQTVLWTSWGRDWTARATPASVVRSVLRTLRPGGTVLLHDTDAHSAPDSWRTTLEATGRLLDLWRDGGVTVGPLGEHGLAEAAHRHVLDR
jgi:peptidoglycan/xylan/chitin deacetylase (PgdA/CDA1 family)